MKNSKNLAKEYNRWHSRAYQIGRLEKTDPRDVSFYNFVLDLLATKKSHRKKKKNILDIACGKGLFLKEAQKRGLEVYGIDISRAAIEAARQAVKGNFLAGNAERLPYKDNNFDYVTCLGSLEHFIHPDIGVREIVRVLKKNGKALVYVPNLMFIGHVYMTWRYGIMPTEAKQSFSEGFYTYKGWKRLLEENGLKVIACKKYNRIYATKRVGRLVVLLWENFLRFFIPLNLSYAFVFLCQKK